MNARAPAACRRSLAARVAASLTRSLARLQARSLAPSPVLALPILLFALALGSGARAAVAPVEARGFAGASLHSVLSRDGDEVDRRTLGVLEARLDVRGESDPWWASLALAPRAEVDWAVPGGPPGSAGTTTGAPAGTSARTSVKTSVEMIEAYVGYRAAAADVLLGRVPLPLETARLTLPFTLSPPDESGRRPGLVGIRADLYRGQSRLRAAAVRSGDHWTPVVGLSHAFAGWEATAHLLAREDGLTAGMAGSGLLGSTVLYGEVWSSPGESGLRYSAGASGYLGDALWTAELARAPFLPGEGAPVPLAALQLAYAPFAGLSLVVDAASAFAAAGAGVGAAGGTGPAAGPGFIAGTEPGAEPGPAAEPEPAPEPENAAGPSPAHRWGIAATYEIVPGQSEIVLTVRRLVAPPAPATTSLGLEYRYYY